MAIDPYAAPKSHVADVLQAGTDGSYIPGGRGVAAGNGWSWISDAWSLLAENRFTAVLLIIVFLVIVIVMSLIPIVGQLGLYFLGPVLSGGMMLGCDALRRRDRLEVGHLFAGFRTHTGRLFGVGAFMLVGFIAIFAVIALTFGAGLVGLFTGGMIGEQPSPEAMGTMAVSMMLGILVALALSIPLYMAIWFAAPLIVLNDMGVSDALKSSFYACLKNILPFLIWGIVMFFLSILATLPVLLGWLLLGPVLFASIYTGYRDIFYEN